MSISLKANSDGTSGAIQINGTDKVTIGSTGIAAGSYAPASITPTELSQKLTLGTAQNSTSGTSIDFTGIPSWVKRITVIFSGVSTNGTSTPLLQLGDAGGIENTGYTGSTGYAANAASSSVLAQTAGFGLSGTITASTTLYLSARIEKLGSGNDWIFSCAGSLVGGAAACISGGGVKTLSDTLTQLRITTAGGTDTFDAGSINIMYE